MVLSGWQQKKAWSGLMVQNDRLDQRNTPAFKQSYVQRLLEGRDGTLDYYYRRSHCL